MSQKPHEPTENDRKQVEMLSGLGIPQEQIGLLIQGGIDDKTLRKYYAAELLSGVAKANSQVSKSLFQKALGDGNQSVTAAIFFLKTRAGWKETQVQQLEVGESFSDFFKAIDGKTRGIPTRG